MSVLRELLDLPHEVKKSDFVIRLTEGVARPEAVLRDYAVTPDLHAAYDKALTLVAAALRDKQSVAAYVHGSFGSGKSHFMAMLSLMLANDPGPWADPQLHDLRLKFEALKQRKLLRLHFHMVGARSLDEKIFGEYLARVREFHPDAPVPPIFEDAALFDNAQSLRAQLGDAAFFSRLSAAQPAAKGWGKLAAAATWDDASFAAALSSTDPDERARLFSALVKTHFPAFAQQSSGFVGFDRGLGILARHAVRLGYDGIVLFLDELILWLASKATDKAWLNTEVQKLAKLVEAQDERREIPIISFVARQRDISEMVGEQLVGLEVQNLKDSLKWWEGRFDTVRLEDRNLPTIVEKRVVKPKSPEAKKRLDEAFAEMRRGLGQAWGTLLGEQGDENAFRQVYPFSPALIETLVSLSNFLQRERTALKVLMEMLVEHLQDFTVGQVVPIGDLFDVLAGGEEPMDGTMKERFAAARRLYANELLPILHAANGTGSKARCQRLRDDHPVYLGCSNCLETRCRADNRLVKTLLLAALAPNVPVLRNLTVSRLVQLNHGSLRSPVQGAEANQAASKLRGWAAEVGKVRVGDDAANPTVAVVLEGVDLKPVLESARLFDTPGARRRKVQEILFTAIGLASGTTQVEHEHVWRGSRRLGLVHFGNVREMEDDALVASPSHDFKIVVDYPFDDAGHSPQEDEARVAAYLERGRATATVVWLPSFFGERIQHALGELVVIDKILEADAWRTHLAHLRPDDQRAAREELANLANQKRQRIRRALEAAYGLKKAEEGELDPARSLDRHFHALAPGMQMSGSLAATLPGALPWAVEALLEQRYPRHPRFAERVTRARLDKNLELFERIVESEGNRIAAGKQELKDLEPANELGIVQVTESSAALRPHRFDEVDRAQRAEGIEVPTVKQIKRLFDPSNVMGLMPEVADFLALSYAMKSGRELVRGGSPLKDAVVGKLPDDAELIRAPMPQAASWQRALDHAAQLFGISIGGRALHAKNLRQLSEKVDARRKEAVAARAHDLEALLVRRQAFFEGDPPRLVTARKVADLLSGLDSVSAVEKVDVLSALAPAPSSTAAMQRHILHAAKTVASLDDEVVFNTLAALRGHADPQAAAVLQRVAKVLATDELNESLSVALRELALEAQRILIKEEKDERPVEEIVAEGRGATLEALDSEREKIARALKHAGPMGTLVFSWRVVKGKH